MKAYGVRPNDIGKVFSTGLYCPCCRPKYWKKYKESRAAKKRARRLATSSLF